MTRITVYYSGRVQGVGFRYTTSRVAGRFAVAGYVMNLHDGRVELVVEADRKEALGFLAAVQEELGGYITDVEQEIGTASGEFGEPSDRGAFSVRR